MGVTPFYNSEIMEITSNPFQYTLNIIQKGDLITNALNKLSKENWKYIDTFNDGKYTHFILIKKSVEAQYVEIPTPIYSTLNKENSSEKIIT